MRNEDNMNFANLKDDDTTQSTTAPTEEAPPSHEASDGEMDESELVVTEKKPINRSALTLFAIIAIGSAATYFMHLRTGPQNARAADPTMVTAEATINDFMKGGNSNILLLRRLLEGTAKIVEQFRDYTNVAQVPLSELKANPFQSAIAKPAPVDDSEATARKLREEEHARVVKAVQGLQLQTIVVRANKKACMISNTLVEEGETIGDFTVEKISSGSVVVKSAGYKFELRMAK
jgi:hypothetical protein